MVTLEQIDAALGLLGIPRSKLAEKLGIKAPTFNAYFTGKNTMSTARAAEVELALLQMGVEFIPDGVRINKSKPIEYKGAEGFKAFYDDIYETALSGDVDICLYNTASEMLSGYLGDFLDMHIERMTNINDRFRFRVVLEEGDDAFLGSSYCEYKWYPKDLFDNNHFYVYGDKVAFVTVSDDPSILVIHNAGMAKVQKHLFDVAWERVAFEPS